jgi:hypothetical protein
MRKFCYHEKTDLEILTDLHIFSPLEYKYVVSGVLALCLYVWAPEQLRNFVHLWC